jgi:hypothetical protein
MDTMKTPDKRTDGKPDGWRTDGKPHEIAVYELRFKSPYPDLGLPSMSGGSGTIRTKDGITIGYLPQQQLYRIVTTSRDPKVKPRTIFVPREWASFEPLPQESA